MGECCRLAIETAPDGRLMRATDDEPSAQQAVKDNANVLHISSSGKGAVAPG